MKNEKTSPAAEKSANVKSAKNQANPLAGKVVPENKTKKVEETPALDPEQEKKIAEAHAAMVKAEQEFADAKAKLADAKTALRKLTGKKAGKGEPKGPGVIATIFTLVSKSGKKGISKDEILGKLTEMFPDRAVNGMEKTINVQLPGRMSKEKKVSIKKLETGCFVLES